MPIKIELEGIDGSSKTSNVRYLYDELTKRGLKCMTMTEAGFSHIDACVKMRKLALDPDSDISSLSMELLFAAQRIENDRWLKTSTQAQLCDVIISDRGYLSHLAYGYASLPKEQITMLFCDILKDVRLPDHIIYLNITPEAAAKRLRERRGPTDKVEALGMSHQQKVLDHFTALLSEKPQRWVGENGTISEIDAGQDREGVAKQLSEWVDGFVSHLRQ